VRGQRVNGGMHGLYAASADRWRRLRGEDDVRFFARRLFDEGKSAEGVEISSKRHR